MKHHQQSKSFFLFFVDVVNVYGDKALKIKVLEMILSK